MENIPSVFFTEPLKVPTNVILVELRFVASSDELQRTIEYSVYFNQKIILKS